MDFLNVYVIIFLVLVILGLLGGLYLYFSEKKETKRLKKELDFYEEKNDQLHIRIGNLQERVDETLACAMETNTKNQVLQEKIELEQENYSKILSQKKSSETRIGRTSENLVPFLSKCPYKPSDMMFLGMPLDYLVFDMDAGEIIFLEVKSGNSRPSKKQRILRDIIKSGNIFYEEIRVGTKGVKLKREKNND